MGNDFLLIRWELMDGFSKFKRHVFRFYCSYDQKFYRWKSTSGFNRKRLFDHNLRSNRRIFKIQTASFQVLLKWWFDIFDALILLPVWTEKLKIGAKTLFSKKNPFRIERVTASILYMAYILSHDSFLYVDSVSSKYLNLQTLLLLYKFSILL